MRKRKIQLSAIAMAAVMMLSVTACGGSGGTAVLTEKDDPEKVLAEATELYNKEELRGAKTESEGFYSDGTSEKTTGTFVFDRKKNVSQSIYETGKVFATKEGDSYYSYVNDEYTKGEWIRYKEETSGEEVASIEYSQNITFDFDDAEYENIKRSSLGN